MLFRSFPNRRSLACVSKRLGWSVSWFATVALVWLSMTATSWAQDFAPEEEPRTYVPSYMIIVFAVAFALMMICRSGKRTTSFHAEE